MSKQDIAVLWEDQDLIIVAKPPNLPCHATLDPNRAHLESLLQAQLRESGYNGPLTLHHRLDRDTSGCVLFSKSSALNAKITELFRSRQVQKSYVALTALNRAVNETSWKVRNYLARKSRNRPEMHSVRSGGDVAETDFSLLNKNSRYAWIQAQPQTGRTHQIRVHLSENQLPILGDDLYASAPLQKAAPRLMLHAYRLEFLHPITQQMVRVTCPLPEDMKACSERHQILFSAGI